MGIDFTNIIHAEKKSIAQGKRQNVNVLRAVVRQMTVACHL